MAKADSEAMDRIYAKEMEVSQMKRRMFSVLVCTTMLASLFGAAAVKAEGVELNVVTTFAGEDSNAKNYQAGLAGWEEETGNTVNDNSATSDETFKTTVVSDFEMDAEPDVLFFFTGADANSFIEAGKVLSIEDIRAEYPDYAANIDDGKLPVSIVDGKAYAVPTNGYWEAMFVNTKVLAEAGVEMPGADYSWDQFLADCEKIKEAGFAPVAAALGNIPHYWWEYAIFNNEETLAAHTVIPAADAADAWVAGMEDIKAMYEAGCFPENTLSATDDETFQLFVQDKAAFLLDGSWKVGGIVGACQSDPDDISTLDTEALDKFDVTFVPSRDKARKASDLIGGFSMGYYITAKAWEDPEKKEAAVSFVNYMTSDDMIVKFAQHSANPLKEAPEVDADALNGLQVKAIDFATQVTSYTGAVQDIFQGECRVPTFDGMPSIVTGDVAAADAVAEGFAIYAESQAE